ACYSGGQVDLAPGYSMIPKSGNRFSEKDHAQAKEPSVLGFRYFLQPRELLRPSLVALLRRLLVPAARLGNIARHAASMLVKKAKTDHCRGKVPGSRFLKPGARGVVIDRNTFASFEDSTQVQHAGRSSDGCRSLVPLASHHIILRHSERA